VLQPPQGVTLDLKDGVLSASGPASVTWLAEASRVAPLIPGVAAFDATLSTDAAVRDAVARLTALSPLFAKGKAILAPGQDDVLRQFVALVGQLDTAAAAVRQRFRLDIIGHTDADGAPEANLPLSRARAATVRAAAQAVASERLEIVDVGVGSDDPAVRSDREADKQRNRRVTVRVTPLGGVATVKAARP
jgi:outer membrane protein OmpA-like peptidoglycan-associated protein